MNRSSCALFFFRPSQTTPTCASCLRFPGLFFSFVLKFPPLAWCSAESGLRCVVFIVTNYICVLPSDAPEFSKRTLPFKLLLQIPLNLTTLQIKPRTAVVCRLYQTALLSTSPQTRTKTSFSASYDILGNILVPGLRSRPHNLTGEF